MKIEEKKIEQRLQATKKRNLILGSLNEYKIYFKNEIFSKFFFLESHVISSFISIRTEISTENLNSRIIAAKKSLTLPVISDEEDRLIFNKYIPGQELNEVKYGVKEPFLDINKQCFPDLIFTPCLAFDLNGYRLGYGGGYYDKTFSHFKSIGHKFVSVGLAYDEQKLENVYHDSFDQKLNYILTEKQLYEVK